MQAIFCNKCGKKIDNNAAFCPACGTKVAVPKINKCPKCGHEQEEDSQFCKYCGQHLASQAAATVTMHSPASPSGAASEPALVEKIKQWYNTYPYAKMIIAAVVVLFFAAIGSYIYFSMMSEDRYLVKYAQASRKITASNELLTGSIKANMNNTELTDVQNAILQQKREIEGIQGDFKSDNFPAKYAAQHKQMIQLLSMQNTILQQSYLILSNPLNNETDNVVAGIKANIDEAKALAQGITVSNTTVEYSTDMLVLPNQLSLFVQEKRKANKEKMDRLNAINDFFKNMDNIIQRYDGAKTDLGGTLTNIRNGGYTWGDYFQLIYQARNSRSSLRASVDNLAAPKGTEGLKRELSEVLSKSILYCDLMRAGANIEWNTRNYSAAKPKYDQAKGVDDQVHSGYEAFIQNYQNEKVRLTNIDNL